MSKIKINFNELLKGLLIILSYFVGSELLVALFLFFFQKNIIPKNDTTTEIVYLLIYIILLLIYFLIYYKSLKKEFKDFKKNYKKYLKIGINYWLKGLFIMITSNILLNLILDMGPSANESANIELLQENLLTQIPIVVLLAPIIEEIVFRNSFKNFTNNKHIYAILTGLIFGGIHILSSLSSLKALLYLIPYCSVGIAFGYLYKKTDNIFSTISIHILHNAINVILIILTMIGA